MSEKFPENVNPDRCVVVVGDLGNGFEIYGPFDCTVDAVDWASDRFDSWEVFNLNIVQCNKNGEWVD